MNVHHIVTASFESWLILNALVLAIVVIKGCGYGGSK